jgi:hypothetical protein
VKKQNPNAEFAEMLKRPQSNLFVGSARPFMKAAFVKENYSLRRSPVA